MLQYFNVHEYRGGRGGAEIHDNAGGQLAGAGCPVHVAGPDQTELVTENEHFNDLQFARCSSEHGAGRSRGGTAVLPYGIHGFCQKHLAPRKQGAYNASASQHEDWWSVVVVMVVVVVLVLVWRHPILGMTAAVW